MKRILFIEDEANTRALVRRFFAELSAPADLVECALFEDGLARTKTEAFDVVLLDLSFPDSDRESTVSRIGEFEAPVVVLTGWVDDQLRERCFAAGCYYFIEKSNVLHGVFNACHNAWLHRRYHPQTHGS